MVEANASPVSEEPAADVKRTIHEQSVIREEDMIELESIDMNLPEDEIIPKLMENLQTVGFFVLTNVPGFDEDALLKAIKAFFKEVPA